MTDPQPAVDLDRLAPDLGHTCGDYLDSYRGRFGNAVQRGEAGVATVRRFARVLDGLLSALYCAAEAASSIHSATSTRSTSALATAQRRSGPVGVGRMALVAVGGYGRGLLGLQSDLDVLFLCDNPEDRHARATAEALLYPLWDLRIDIGHAVRSVDETLRLAREDIRTATTLLDVRRIAGDASIVEELKKGGRRQVFEPALDDFLDMLAADTEARHARFGGSLYLLEPEVKLGQGGLRDLDVVAWAGRARWGLGEPVRTGALLQREATELDAACEMLWRVRNLLHVRAGRKQDRLTFADQEEIATELGFVDGVTLGVEQFMQAYYRHARVVSATAERMLERARPRRRRVRASLVDLGDGTATFDDHVTMIDSGRLGEDPALALRFYRQVARRKLRPYPYARDAIARSAAEPPWRERLRDDEESTSLFLDLLCHVGDVPLRRSLLAELHEAGLTLAMVPELEPLLGRVQHDVFHVYTVDVHAVRATARLSELVAGRHAKALPLPTRLACEAPRRAPLFVALFLHALGRTHGHRHPERGAAMVRPIAERLGLSSVDVDHVVWLVQWQTSYYHWATRRDTTDPAALAELAVQVRTPERLRDLYLLTVCSLSTTNPTAMTAWKAHVLDDLYFALSAVLAEGPAATTSRAEALRAEVRIGFVGDAERDALEAFLDGMPDRYVLANPVDVIRRHARSYRDARGAPLAVSCAPSLSPELQELLFITDDRPGMLADITASLAAHQIGIVEAQIYTQGERALDVFQVRRESRGGTSREIDELLVARIRSDLERCLAGTLTAAALMGQVPKAPTWARRHSPPIPTEVGVDNEASPRFSVVDVYTKDRLGVLQLIASTLHEAGLSIALSKVNTEGERVADVFYVQDSTGTKVRDPRRLAELRERLETRVAGFHAQADAEGQL